MLVHLLKHQLLFSFNSTFIECVGALSNIEKDVISRILESITKLWSNNKQKTLVLFRTVVGLYDFCDDSQKDLIQLWIIEHLFKLFSDNEFQIAEESINFCNHLLIENTAFWQNRQNDIRTLVDALEKVNWMKVLKL